MKTYPSIPKAFTAPQPVYAFDKLDGSNIRAEWHKKKGIVKFGTRRRLLDPKEEPLGEAVGLILDKYGEEIERRTPKLRADRVTFFFEFFGPNSFAGFHENEEHDVVLFDVDVYKKGIMPPREFLKFSDGLEIPELIYQGNVNQDLVNAVWHSTLDGMTHEGIVCKWNPEKKQSINMLKLKSKAWLDRLKQKCGDDEKLFEQLA
jgi:hypothetical protein